MKNLPSDVEEIDVTLIRPFIRRSRNAEAFNGFVASIKKNGLKVPIEVRDISDEPPAERKREGGGHYKYELIKGEGRTLAFTFLGKKKISAYVTKAKQSEIVGRFLAENIIRKPLPWAEKSEMVRAMARDGMKPDQIAAELSISLTHALKFMRIATNIAPGLEREVAAMPMNDAEVFAALPADHQNIVVEVLRENPEREVRDVLRKAREITTAGQQLTPAAVRASLKRVDEDLANLRKSMKVTRLHWALGVQNLQTLLGNKKFRAALTAAKVNVSKFEEVCQ